MKRIESKRSLRLNGRDPFALTSQSSPKTPVFTYLPNFLSRIEQEKLFEFLEGKDIGFCDERSFYGNPPTHQYRYWGAADYEYSGKKHPACPMPAEIVKVRDDVLAELGDYRYESVLANRYRDGRDSICRHRDDPKDLDLTAPIAGVNLGAEREMKLYVERGVVVRVMVRPGSLYWFSPCLEHSVDKIPSMEEAKAVGVRYNLTFRERR